MKQYTKFYIYISSSLLLLFSFFLPTTNSLIYNNFPLSFTESTSDRSQFPNENCLLVEDYTLYDLFSLTDKLYNLNSTDPNYQISYQFCKDIKSYSSSVIAKKSDNTIIKLAGSTSGSENNKNKITINETTETVTLHLSYGDKCKFNETLKYIFDIELTCNENIEYEFISINDQKEINLNNCEFLLKANSKYACGNKDKYKITKFMNNAKIYLSIVFIILGNLTGIFGYKYLKVAFFISSILVFAIIFILIYALIGVGNFIIFYIVLGAGLLTGAIIGFLLIRNNKKKYIKIYMSIMGMAMGFLIGVFISQILISFLESQYQKFIYIGLAIIFTIIGGVLGLFFSRKICILSTSTIGGYIFMKGISFLLKGKIDYINEQVIFDYARTGNFEQIENTVKGLFYIYPAMWIVFTIIYIIIQHFINHKRDDCDDYRELESKFEKNTISDDRLNSGSIDEGAETNNILP